MIMKNWGFPSSIFAINMAKSAVFVTKLHVCYKKVFIQIAWRLSERLTIGSKKIRKHQEHLKIEWGHSLVPNIPLNISGCAQRAMLLYDWEIF